MSIRNFIMACIFAFICCLTTICPIHAEQDSEIVPDLPNSNFPDWMNEETDPKPAAQGLNPPIDPESTAPAEPHSPSDPDPDSQIRPPSAPESSGRFQFKWKKPVMPDFSRFREKAKKIAYDKKPGSASSSEELSFESFNDEWAQNRLQEIDKILPSISDRAARIALERERETLSRKIAAAEELNSIIASVSDGTASSADISAIDSAKQRRINDLRRILFEKPAESLITPTDSTPVRGNATGTYGIPERFYRPARRKSLFEESREERKRRSH